MNYRGQWVINKKQLPILLQCEDKELGIVLKALFKHLVQQESADSVLKGASSSVKLAFRLLVEQSSDRVSPIGDGMSHPSLSPSSKGDERKEPKERRVKNNSPSHTLFARFWEVYPRKVGKVVAEKAFLKCVDGLPEEDAAELVDRMIDAVRSQSRSAQWQDDERFIPHPSTWLNQHRWEDETAIDPIEAAAQAREDACAESNRQMAEIAKRFAAPEERA